MSTLIRAKKVALFIGRFQPFHNGHHSVLKYIDLQDEISEIIIGMGSVNEVNTFMNPFDVEERKLMILKSIKLNKPVSFVEIPDFEKNEDWTNFITENFPEYPVIYTRNDLVEELLTKAGYEVKKFPFLKGVTGTKVREMIKQDQNWIELVPVNTAKLIKKISGTVRIKLISNQIR